MPIFFDLTLSIIFGSGFYYIGFVIVNNLKLKEVVSKISNPAYQYILFGISFFLLLLYPLFFLGFIKNYLFKFISYIILILGVLNFFIFYKYIIKFFIILFKKRFLFDKNYLFTIFIILYFFLSLTPITSGDSLSYHSVVAKHISFFGEFPRDSFEFASALSGIGEFLNAFPFSVKATTFSSFIHFIGLISILGILDKLLSVNNIKIKDRQFFFLLVLSCPVLIFLISSSKPQFFYTSLIVFGYSSLINIRNFRSQKELSKIFFISIIFSSVAFLAKFSFIISLSLIIINYLYLIKKIFNFYKIFFFSIILLLLFLLPSLIWKQNLYNYPFYHFLINPLPINIPGFYELYFSAKDYDSFGFPFSLFLPLSFSSLTTFLGFGCLIIFFLIKPNYENKKLFLFNIFFFLFFLTSFGQRSPRFYLEIYLFSILLFILTFSVFRISRFYIYFKFIIYLQSVFTFLLLIYGVTTLFPGSLTNNFNKIILSKYANGYNLYSWTNEVLPSNSKIITNHRSTYFSVNESLFLDFTFYINFDDNFKRDYWLVKLKEQKPDFILFYGNDNFYNYSTFNFKDCLGEIYAFQNALGFHATRNPFNKNSIKYNAYIYKFNSEKLPSCVKKN
jgi:hypothetical protein